VKRCGSLKKLKPTFFNTTFLSYILGLATTIFVMHTFQAAQPALLYLVPFCVGSSIITGLATGSLGKLVNYEEEETVTEKVETSSKKSQ
tara:strand:+ start:1590 stop:1856 length:267 start_codon:yes stop_codon:yes gene_type:complete